MIGSCRRIALTIRDHYDAIERGAYEQAHEAAAGSRYITIPVTITAVTTNQKMQRFQGTYTLRRRVVPGATMEQRTWHLYSADIQQIQ